MVKATLCTQPTSSTMQKTSGPRSLFSSSANHYLVHQCTLIPGKLQPRNGLYQQKSILQQPVGTHHRWTMVTGGKHVSHATQPDDKTCVSTTPVAQMVNDSSYLWAVSLTNT